MPRSIAVSMQRMQVVEATERWVDARLRALACALDLPCPVHESFLFDADHAFYTQCTPWNRLVGGVLDISLLARTLTVLAVAVVAILIALP